MQNAPNHKYLYESECCSVSSIRLENYHIFKKGLAKNTFTICNVTQHCCITTTKLKIFSSRTTLTGALCRINIKAVPASFTSKRLMNLTAVKSSNAADLSSKPSPPAHSLQSNEKSLYLQKCQLLWIRDLQTR